MPTLPEATKQYLPRQQRYYGPEAPNPSVRSSAQSTDTVIKSIDVGPLIEIPSGPSLMKPLFIIFSIIGGSVIVASAITIPIVLTRNKTVTNTSTSISTSTSTTTTTTYPYPSGISLLPPAASLLNISNPSSSSSYFNVSWLYYAQGYNETLTFAIQNNPSYTEIDDVSVLDGTQELLCNGGFENGSMICWQGANHLSTSNCYSGTYCYNDGVVGAPDYVWQTFSTTPGTLLYISFWIEWQGSGGGIYTNVSIYP